MRLFAQNDRSDSVQIGNGANTDFTSQSASTFIPKRIQKPTENSETIKLKISYDHLRQDPNAEREQSMQTVQQVYDDKTHYESGLNKSKDQ